jgi:hypothetical protein
MLFCCTGNSNFQNKMGKTACKKKDFKDSDDPKYICKGCGAKVKKEEKVCKPKKIKS